MLINLIYLMIILPLVWMAVDKSQARWKRSLIICFGYFLLYKLTLLIPSYVPWLRTESLNWNWSGKLLAILFSVGFYFAFRSLFKDNLFLNLRPQRDGLAASIALMLLVAVVAVLEGVLFYNQPWDTETILFQLTLPGIDEEIAYRGVILGILTSIIPDEQRVGKLSIKYPAIWIVGLLFGLIHALNFGRDGALSFDLLYFVKTFSLGVIWSIMAIRTRSLLLPIVSHNLSNTLANWIGMIK